MTGPVVIDYKGDRIMDYLVWYLASDSYKFDGYMKIPLTKASRNTTACVEWLVKRRTLYRPIYTLKSNNENGNKIRLIFDDVIDKISWRLLWSMVYNLFMSLSCIVDAHYCMIRV